MPYDSIREEKIYQNLAKGLKLDCLKRILKTIIERLLLLRVLVFTSGLTKQQVR